MNFHIYCVFLSLEYDVLVISVCVSLNVKVNSAISSSQFVVGQMQSKAIFCFKEIGGR